MTRRGGQLPWGGSGESGLYRSRRGGAGRLAVLAVLAVAVLGVIALIVSRACGSDSCDAMYCPSDRDIDAPDGYELVSDIFEYNEASGPIPSGVVPAVQVELKNPVADGAGLSFYRYVEETQNWETITPAIIDAQGKVVSGTFPDAAPIMAVMRRDAPGGSVVAYLPHNAQLNRDAAGHVTIVHPIDFAPQADGTVGGELSAIQSDGTFEVYPVIAANAGQQGQVAIVESILQDSAARSGHVQQILAKVNEVNVKGIDIAYMDLPATQRTSFSLFVAELAQALHGQNKQLTLTLPSPIKVQNRIDEGAYDYGELGKSADLIKIAPYRDQATYRLVMPEVLQFLTERVTPAKLVLTVTPYATETGGEVVGRLALVDAMNIATRISVGASADALTTNTQVDVIGTNINRDENLTGLRWYPETATVAFSYKQPQGGGSRTIYIENFFSTGFKLELIPQYKLGGVAVEDASDNVLLGNIWTALTPFVTSGLPILMQPNPDDLLPRWTVSEGKIEDTTRGSARWFTPGAPGAYAISLTLSDGVAMFENSVQVNVAARESTPSPSPTQAN